MLKLRITTYRDDDTRRRVLRFSPVFTPTQLATGELAFPYFEAWEDEPATHGPQKAAAIANAREILAIFAQP